MELMKITEVTDKFEVSSRTLRYYEEIGLLHSERPAFEKYRFYSSENISRLQQILILRKMQIPIKDILRIYDSQDMEILVQSFVKRLDEIDDEINTLSQLRTYVNDFLKAMMTHGITQITALPLLYDKMEAELFSSNKQVEIKETLDSLSDKMAKPLEIDIVTLPSMHVMTSVRTDSGESDIDGFWDWLSVNQIPFGKPGSRTLFEYQHDGTIIMIQKVDQNMEDGPFICQEFPGGFYAVTSAFADEDLGSMQYRIIQCFDDNPSFEVDFLHNGALRHDTLIESVYSLDSERDRVNIFIPVKERKPNFTDYSDIEQIQNITVSEVEKANPILREYGVDFNKITPIYSPHYKVLDNGEAEFIAWISERKLDTNIAVKLPFRIDIEFLAEEENEKYLWGTTEGSLWFSHGNSTYTMNAENYADKGLKKHAISFSQPILGNELIYPGIGEYPHDQFIRMSWIIGEKHFVVIVNEEVRFCGTNFPYMSMNLHLQTPQPILIGSNGQGKKLFRSIKISQLKITPKTNSKQEILSVDIRQSNNKLPNLRQIVHPEYGQNYWFNGCAAYLMECLGEKSFDYEFFAGITGENFVQVFSKDIFLGNGLVDYRLSEKGNYKFIERTFKQCGYDSDFVPLAQICKERDMYIQKLIMYIDRGIPVIINNYGKNPNHRYGWSVIVGYSNYGKTLIYIGGDGTEPDAIAKEDLLSSDYTDTDENCYGWLFIGEKRKDRSLSVIYRESILSLPQLFSTETALYCLGAKAFRTWADYIEKGYYEHIKSDEFDNWAMYTVYICCLATNSSVNKGFLEKALALNPDLTFIPDIITLYEQMERFWNNDNGSDLEALGGGFNVTLDLLQDKNRRRNIVGKLRSFAECTDEVALLIEQFKQNGK